MLTTFEVGIRYTCHFIPKENEANQIKLARTSIKKLVWLHWDCIDLYLISKCVIFIIFVLNLGGGNKLWIRIILKYFHFSYTTPQFCYILCIRTTLGVGVKDYILVPHPYPWWYMIFESPTLDLWKLLTWWPSTCTF